MGRWRRLNKGKVVGTATTRRAVCAAIVGALRSTATGGTRAFQPQERGLDLSLPLLDLVARQLARSNLGRLACCACELRSRTVGARQASMPSSKRRPKATCRCCARCWRPARAASRARGRSLSWTRRVLAIANQDRFLASGSGQSPGGSAGAAQHRCWRRQCVY